MKLLSVKLRRTVVETVEAVVEVADDDDEVALKANRSLTDMIVELTSAALWPDGEFEGETSSVKIEVESVSNLTGWQPASWRISRAAAAICDEEGASGGGDWLTIAAVEDPHGDAMEAYLAAAVDEPVRKPTTLYRGEDRLWFCGRPRKSYSADPMHAFVFPTRESAEGMLARKLALLVGFAAVSAEDDKAP